MGVISTNIKLRNFLNGTTFIDVPAKVDTGATLLVIPGSIAEIFNFPVIRQETVKFANEELSERYVVGGIELEICGRTGWFEAIVEPKKTYALLGAIVMESLDLIVEPKALTIYPNPRSVLPMAEIE